MASTFFSCMKISNIYNNYNAVEKNIINYLLRYKFNIKLSDIALDEDININFDILDECIKRALNSEPLQYIVGYQDFMGLNLYVDKRVLIPRPETEQLVDIIGRYNISEKKVLDMCCGSGAIGIALQKLYNCNISFADISEDALDVTHINIKLNDINYDNIFSTNLFSNVIGKFDIIVSNPPYIDTKEVLKLDKNVREYEPHMALDGGIGGLEIIYKLINDAPNYLNDSGMLFLEIGYDQGKAIEELLKKDFTDICVIKDYNNFDRIVVAKLR